MRNFLIIEDHFLIRKSLKILLKEQFPQSLILEAEHFEQALALLPSAQIELVILDIGIHDGRDTSMIKLIRQRQPQTAILICTEADEKKNALNCIIAGADGYLLKSASEDQTVHAISTVLKGNKYLSPLVQQQLLSGTPLRAQTGINTPPVTNLSRREQEIVELIIAGKWVKEIAAILGIRPNTVSTYKTRIFKKMGIASVIELFPKTSSTH